MIRFALRLTVRGGREAATRLVVTAAAVALGVGLLLSTLAVLNAVNAQNSRYAWLESGSTSARRTTAADPLWWLLTADVFHGKTIGRLDVAATGPSSPVPPGITTLPGPGEYYASPALRRLLQSTSAAELGVRYPGRFVGTIDSAALPSPDSLIVVVGHSAGEMAAQPRATEVTGISTVTPNHCSSDCAAIGFNANAIDLILSVAVAGLLFPVLIFIGTATRLSAARREQRFAAMRLVGATPRQISVISSVESTVAAAVGVAGGFGIFFLLRSLLASIAFTGSRFFVSDVSLNRFDVLLAVIGVPIAAATAARLAMRRVVISPLGVTRRVTPRPPRAWRLIPLLAGIGELGYFVLVGRPDTTAGQVKAFLPGFLVTMAGLVIAGPWFTMVGSRLVVRRARRPATLIAGRRLADSPHTGFRAISGLVLALFVGSVSVAVISSWVANNGAPPAGTAAGGTLIRDFATFGPNGPTYLPAMRDDIRADLRAIPGVEALTMAHAAPGSDARGFPSPLVSCAELAHTPALGRCPAGAGVVRLDSFGNWYRAASTTWTPVSLSPAQLDSLPVQLLIVATDGSHAAVERARTVLEQAYPMAGPWWVPTTMDEMRAQDARQTRQYEQLADIIIVSSLAIAGCSLAVSVAGGLNERKRPFGLLRLSGAPLAMLRRVVALETAVPLLVVSAVSIGLGFLAAGLFLRAQLGLSLVAPGSPFYSAVGAGLALSLAVIGSTFPLLERITGPETARNE